MLCHLSHQGSPNEVDSWFIKHQLNNSPRLLEYPFLHLLSIPNTHPSRHNSKSNSFSMFSESSHPFPEIDSLFLSWNLTVQNSTDNFLLLLGRYLFTCLLRILQIASFLKKDVYVPLIFSPHLLLVFCVPASLVAQTVKHLPAMQETWVQSLGWEDPLEKEMTTHISTLAWKIPWTKEPVGYSPCGHKDSDMTERLHFFFLSFTFYFIGSFTYLTNINQTSLMGYTMLCFSIKWEGKKKKKIQPLP